MTPAEYGFAVGAGLQQGFSNVLMGLREARAAQEQSLRERAFIEEMRQNDLLFPLKRTQIENQTKAIRLQAEQQQMAMDLKNAEIEIASAVAPVSLELDLMSRAKPSELANFQIPDIKIQHSNPKMAEYATAIARERLQAKKNQLIEATMEYKDIQDTAQTLFQAARLPDMQGPLRSELRTAGSKLLSGGWGALTEHERANILPMGQRAVYKASPEYKKSLMEEREMRVKERGAATKSYGELTKAEQGLFTTQEERSKISETKKPLIVEMTGVEEGATKTRGGGTTETATEQETRRAATEQVDLQPFKLKIAQGAMRIREGKSATDIIDNLAVEYLKLLKLPNTPANRQSSRDKVLEAMQQSGVQLPRFMPSDYTQGEELPIGEEE